LIFNLHLRNLEELVIQMSSLNSPPAKRRKTFSQLGNTKVKDPSRNGGPESSLKSLRRSITPPRSNRATPTPTKNGCGEIDPVTQYVAQLVKDPNPSEIEAHDGDLGDLKTKILPTEGVVKGKMKASNHTNDRKQQKVKVIRSPFRLTHIRDLTGESNIDTVTLNDILADPMIKECWQFNFLFDIDFVMCVSPPHYNLP
jgi:hypothetical protein